MVGAAHGALTADMQTCRNSISLDLSTGYVLSWVVAVVLDILLPYEPDDTVRGNRAAAAAAAQKPCGLQQSLNAQLRDGDPRDLAASPKLQDLHADRTA